MNCTRCKQGILQPGFLDDLFPARTCNGCGGSFILLKDYLHWRDKHPDHVFTDAKVEPIPDAPKHAFLCPVTGALMVPYRISKSSQHRLDLSPKINGIWLDKGEWGLLKAEGLAGSLNRIFTDPWQRKIREEAAKEVFASLYQNQFGEVDYSRLGEMRAWIWKHPRRDALLAYLNDDDPYSAAR